MKCEKTQVKKAVADVFAYNMTDDKGKGDSGHGVRCIHSCSQWKYVLQNVLGVATYNLRNRQPKDGIYFTFRSMMCM